MGENKDLNSEYTQYKHSDRFSDVLDAVQRRWQSLLVERLSAAQLTLPEVPLTSPPRGEDELQRLCCAGACNINHWSSFCTCLALTDALAPMHGPSAAAMAALSCAVPALTTAWERISSRESPFAVRLQDEEADVLLYDAEDVVQATIQPVTLQAQASSVGGGRWARLRLLQCSVARALCQRCAAR
jgi:hypothetical protein